MLSMKNMGAQLDEPLPPPLPPTQAPQQLETQQQIQYDPRSGPIIPPKDLEALVAEQATANLPQVKHESPKSL
jgi:hypothetical protein